jgi:holin-like protein
MIVSLTVILLCQLLGEVVARGFGWPLPGPVLGMLFLLVFLGLRDRIATRVPELGKTLDSTGKGLLAHLSLLFIPASVGVIQRLDVLAKYGIGLAVALVVSTFVTLVVTVVTFVVVLRLSGGSIETPEQER